MKLRQVIICVDDEKIILDSLQKMLIRNLGKDYQLEFAESAEEAFEIIESLDRDQQLFVIITDWLMPTMKGDEFLSRIKSNHPGIKTIMLSGQADQKAVNIAKDNSFLDYFISKPWEEKELIHLILD